VRARASIKEVRPGLVLLFDPEGKYLGVLGCFCQDCGDKGDDGLDYLVRNSVWKRAAPEDGFLCHWCLSDRIERPLLAADFVPGFGPREMRMRASIMKRALKLPCVHGNTGCIECQWDLLHTLKDLDTRNAMLDPQIALAETIEKLLKQQNLTN
jgi:hypothetical protein